MGMSKREHISNIINDKYVNRTIFLQKNPYLYSVPKNTLVDIFYQNLMIYK